MSDLADLVEPLKRAVAVPGTFVDVFPDTSDDDLAALLADSFAEAQLDGFLSGFEVDLNTSFTTPDLTTPHTALLVIYGSYRMLINEIRNTQNRLRYVAGPVEYETEQTASMLNEILRQLGDKKKGILDQARLGEFDTSGVFVADLAHIKATQDYGWHSDLTLHEYEAL